MINREYFRKSNSRNHSHNEITSIILALNYYALIWSVNHRWVYGTTNPLRLRPLSILLTVTFKNVLHEMASGTH